MTFLEVLNLLRSHLMRIIVVTLACAAIAGVSMAVRGLIAPEFSASSVLSISQGDIVSVSDIASVAASEVSSDGVEIQIDITTQPDTVTFTATGSSADGCVVISNDVLSITKSEAEKQGVLVACMTTEATDAVFLGKNPVLYGTVGAMAGLLAIVAYYVIKDTAR